MRGLFAVPMQVNPAFAESVNSGSFGTISAKFYPPDSPNNPVPGVYYLRHIGFLGAQPPSVKGMDTPEFSEDDDDCICFHEPYDISQYGQTRALETAASVFRRIRNWFIEKEGAEKADRVVPQWEIDSINELANREEPGRDSDFKGPSAFSENTPILTGEHRDP